MRKLEQTGAPPPRSDPGGRSRRAAGRITAELHPRALSHAIAALLPMVALSVATGSPAWSQAMLVTVSAIVAKENAQLAPAGVLLHGAVIAAGFLVLLVSLGSPPLFVVAACAAAGASILITARGARLRTLGNFTFIPMLYLACEIGEKAGGISLPARGLAYLPYVAAAVLPVALIAGVEHFRDRDPGQSRSRHLGRFLRRAADHGGRVPMIEALVAVVLAVGTASIAVELHHLDHGQWVIWSAASVVVGDFESSRRKLYDRYLGVIVGVPLGTAIGLLLPQSDAVRTIAGLGAVLTLLAFRRYVVGFAARCTLIALVLVDAGQSTFSAVERIQNVVLGGAIGIAFVFGVHGLELIRRRMLGIVR